MFYYSKTMVFEGPGGPGSLLFSDVFQVLFLGTTFSVFFMHFMRLLAPMGSQMGSFGVPWGHHFGTN